MDSITCLRICYGSSNTSSRKHQLGVFHDHLADQDIVAKRLAPFDVVCIYARANSDAGVIAGMPAKIEVDCVHRSQERLDRLGRRRGTRHHRRAHRLYVCAAIELTWALILASARYIPSEAAS